MRPPLSPFAALEETLNRIVTEQGFPTNMALLSMAHVLAVGIARHCPADNALFALDTLYAVMRARVAEELNHKRELH